MSLQILHDRDLWESFPLLQQHGIFLQSEPQKHLYEGLGQKTWLMEFPSKNGPIRSLVTKVCARRGTFLFLPYGPMMENPLSREEDLSNFFAELGKCAKQEGASFIRVSPFWDDGNPLRKLLKNLGLRMAPLHMLAETLWILPLEGRTEDQIFSGMDKKHRNLIRRAEKEEVTVRISTDPSSVDRFIQLHWQTKDRHKFTPYPKEYFRLQGELFLRSEEIKIFEAFWKGELIASAMIMFYGNSAAYHHGASSSDPQARKIPASYLLQWEIIREAIRQKMNFYNFWGIASRENPKHPFYGITHFKSGFGGFQKDLIPAHDLVLSPKYAVNWIIEKSRKWKRGF